MSIEVKFPVELEWVRMLYLLYNNCEETKTARNFSRRLAGKTIRGFGPFLEDDSVQNSRQWMVWCVGLAGMLTLGCAVFGSLWSGLSSLGDVQGAKVCQGVFWGLVLCWVLNGIGLIGLLTAHVLNLTAQPETMPANIASEDPQASWNQAMPFE